MKAYGGRGGKSVCHVISLFSNFYFWLSGLLDRVEDLKFYNCKDEISPSHSSNVICEGIVCQFCCKLQKNLQNALPNKVQRI